VDGLLIIDKPEGMTSAEVVRVVKRRVRSKTGHLGTLDPFASGVLPLCLGEGTKIAQFLNAADKEYTGTIRVGSRTDTGDPTGTVIATAPVPALDAAGLARCAEQFRGELMQTPPMYSAIKQQGTPLYKLARRGVEVVREARRVRIDGLELSSNDSGTISFSVACSKGTYIRVLAEEIAVSLGTVGHLAALRRTRFGHFRVTDAHALAALDGEPLLPLIGLRDALQGLREISLSAAAAQRARQGYQPMLGAIAPGTENEAVKLVGPVGELAAVIVMEASGWRFARVFAGSGAASS